MTFDNKQPNDAVDFYSDIAPDFHASYRHDANRLERMRVWGACLDRYAGGAKFAYDIGCGSGVLACEIAGRGIEIIAVDGAKSMLDIAARMAKDRCLTNVSFQQHRLPFNTTGYREADIVTSSSVIEYLESIPASLVFLRSLLKQNGVVIFSVSNRDSLSRKLVRWAHTLTGRPKYFGFLRHFMTIESVKSELSASGLAYVEHEYFGRADRMNRVLSVFLGPKYSSNMILVVARKI